MLVLLMSSSTSSVHLRIIYVDLFFDCVIGNEFMQHLYGAHHASGLVSIKSTCISTLSYDATVLSDFSALFVAPSSCTPSARAPNVSSQQPRDK